MLLLKFMLQVEFLMDYLRFHFASIFKKMSNKFLICLQDFHCYISIEFVSLQFQHSYASLSNSLFIFLN